MSFREQNRKMWDARVPFHLQSEFYDLPGFKAGRSSLQSFEPDELASVEGKSLVHLQCHIGLDTLSWARLGASVTGLDFSEPAIQAASALAGELGIDARFVCADVYAAPQAVGQRFDVVYTGIGALLWLNDLQAWASVVDQLLEPGGLFYIVECHPAADIFADESLTVERGYFHDPAGWIEESSGSYASPDAPTEHNLSVTFQHTLSDVVSALLACGLSLELFREHSHTAYARWPFMVQRSKTRYEFPTGMPKLPLLYSLKFSKAGPL